jgi:facilitated trehalose transporter
LLLTVGILFASCLGNFIGWRLLAGLCAIPSVLMTVMMFFMPESPTHIIFNKKISRNSVEEARMSLVRLRTDHSTIDTELEQLIQSKNHLTTKQFNIFKRLKQADYYKPLIFSLSLMLIQQLSGINAVVFYIHENFKTAIPSFDPDLGTFLVFSGQTLSTFIESLIVDRFGRRILLVLSGFGCAIDAGLTGFFYLMQEYVPDVAAQYRLLPVFSLVGFVFWFSIGFAPIPWMMIPEMTPVEARNFVTTCATALNYAIAFMITLAFPFVKEAYGPGVIYIGFFTITMIGTLFLLVCLPETSGKTLHELRSHYACGWKNSLFSATVSRRLSITLAASNLNLPANDQLRVTTSM